MNTWNNNEIVEKKFYSKITVDVNLAVTGNILDFYITEIPHKEIIMLNFLLGNLCQINNLNAKWLSLFNGSRGC